MEHHNNAVADPREVERAKAFWVNFMEMSKYTIFAVIGLLVLMAVFLL